MSPADLATVKNLFRNVGQTAQVGMRKRAIESIKRLRAEKKIESEKELLAVAIFLIESLETEG